MERKSIITWVILLILTIVSGIISTQSYVFIPIIILLFASFKFLGVAFDFMELKKANTLWKVVLISFLVLFNSVIMILLIN
ncbi:MAG: cytochrome C oxidase subunit IV family protein [Flavobacteriaceae bacterium]|nr:cytochrome C oxidase subunit IV family protein [Flavobacteriaceae bacterium]